MHTPALRIATHFLLTLETVVFLFHLLSTTSKPFSSLSTRLAHAARLGSFTEKTRYINLLLLLVGVSFGVRRMNKCRKVKLYRSNDHKLVISKARNTNSGLFDGI